MDWYRNGVHQARQSPHVEPKNYTFHGTFNPVRAGDGIGYSDKFSFECNVGDNCHGSITIAGELRQVN